MKKKMLTVSNWLLTTLVGILGFSACEDGPWSGRLEYGTPYATYSIKGKVVNNTNQPIPAIQIVIDANSEGGVPIQLGVLTTDNKGEFQKEFSLSPGDITFSLKIDDVDGVANGLYKSSTQSVIAKKNELVGGSGWNQGKVEKNISVTLESDIK